MYKKDISFILFSNGMGGAEQVVVQLIKNLDKNKFNIFLITNNEMIGFFSGIIKSENILSIGKLYNFSKNRFLNRLINKIGRNINFQKKIVNYNLRKIEKFIQSNNIKVLHSHLMFDLYASYLLKKRQPNITLIYTIHGFLNLDPSINIKYSISHSDFIQFIKKVDVITCVSKLLQENVIKSLPDIKPKCIYIPNALDKKEINKVKELSNYNISDKIELLFMGGEKEVKGGLKLLESIERLLVYLNVKNFRLTILGKVNKEGLFYQKILNNSILKDHINLVGFVKPPNHLKYVKNSDVLIMPSKSEGMPIALFEAIALDSFPLVSNIEIFKEFLVNKKTGILCNTDTSSLSKALYQIILDSTLRNEIIKNNKKFKIPYWENIIIEYEKIYLVKGSIGNE